MSKLLSVVCLAVVSIFVVGCSTVTEIAFDEPVGASMRIQGKDHIFPAIVSLPQRTTVGMRNGAYDLSMSVPAGSGSAMLSVRGKLYVYRVMFSDVDLMARIFFRIPAEKLQALRDGSAVTIEGFSADGGKLVYRAVLGLATGD